MSAFDILIVGAGSAGCVLAHRLSADGTKRVCLLEAGPPDRNPLIHVPLGLMGLMRHRRLNWRFKSSPQKDLGGRRISIPRGKMLGGSSALNGMVYIRGVPSDYDAWAAGGCTGWGWEDVLPYFRKSERFDGIAEHDLHGSDGPLPVTKLAEPHPLDDDFVNAAGALQIPRNDDFNGQGQEGVGVFHVTQSKGRRASTAVAFLRPATQCANLAVRTGAEIKQLVIKDHRVTGVVLQSGETIDAAETILCAGAIGSPQILLASGVGPAAELQAIGKRPILDLQGVGRNLHDHVNATVIHRMKEARSYGLSLRALPKLIRDTARYPFSGRGIFGSNMVEAGGFIRTDPGLPTPDVQFHFIPGRKSHRGRSFEFGHGFALHSCVLRPHSRGRMTLAPDGQPNIDLGLLSDDRDLDVLLKGVKLARRILAQSPLAAFEAREIAPGPEIASDCELADWIRSTANTVYHPVGTCRMGTGPDAVVTPDLRVHGLRGLRIVDASIMPSIPSGNTNAPTIMIAEKAADLVLSDRN